MILAPWFPQCTFTTVYVSRFKALVLNFEWKTKLSENAGWSSFLWWGLFHVARILQFEKKLWWKVMSFHLSFHFLASFISRTLGYQVMFRLKLLTWWSVAGRGSQAGEGLTQPGSWDCHNRPVLPMTWPWQRNYLLWTNHIFMTK